MGKSAIKEGLSRWAERYAAKSDSGGEDYFVCKDHDGKWACSCMGWTRHIYCPHCGHAVKKDHALCMRCGEDLRVRKPVRGNCKHIDRALRGDPSVRSISQAVLERLLG